MIARLRRRQLGSALPASQWVWIGLFCVYVLAALEGIELLSPVLGQELALGIFAAIGVFVALAAIKVAEHIAARRRMAAHHLVEE